MAKETKTAEELYLKNLKDGSIKPTTRGVWDVVKRKRHPRENTHLFNLVDKDGEIIEEGSLISSADTDSKKNADDAEQASDIIGKAKKDAKEIIDDAKKKAEKIISDAKATAEDPLMKLTLKELKAKAIDLEAAEEDLKPIKKKQEVIDLIHALEEESEESEDSDVSEEDKNSDDGREDNGAEPVKSLREQVAEQDNQ